MLKTRRSVLTIIAALAIAALAPVSTSLAAGTLDLPLRLRANGGHYSGATSFVDVSIKSWSSAEEHASVVRAAAEGAMVPRGDTTLRELLQSSDTRGRISLTGELGFDIRYAYEFEEDGRRRIVLAADRPINVGEAIDSGAISLDYNVAVAVIELDESGSGEGELWTAAEITLDNDGRVKATGIDVEPIRLGRVRIVD